MFESGLEGVSIKILKKSQFEQIECNSDQKPHCETNANNKKSGEEQKMSSSTPKLAEKVTGTKSSKSGEESKEKEKGEATNSKDTGNVSSCMIELKVVWFNFAAPPRAPITRKIDFTR